MKKEKKYNPSKDFKDNYADEFEGLLKVPMVALSSKNKELVPYEYSDKLLRYRRIDKEIDDYLSHNALSLTKYCVVNKIEKFLLGMVTGGNLYDYYKMKHSFGKGN